MQSRCDYTLRYITLMLMFTLGVVLSTGDGLSAVSWVPYGVEPAVFVCALIRVAAKEVSLCLDQVSWQACTPNAVEVAQRGCHAWRAQACNQTAHSRQACPQTGQESCMHPHVGADLLTEPGNATTAHAQHDGVYRAEAGCLPLYVSSQTDLVDAKYQCLS